MTTTSPADPAPEERRFRQAAAHADFTLVIAPEFAGLLEERCRWAEQAGSRLLGPAPAAVRLTADKLALAEHLLAAGVPTPRCWPLGEQPPGLYPLVVKPRDGAGSQATFLLRGPEDWPRVEGWAGPMIAQEYAPGRPASVAFLIGPKACVALPPAWQELSGDGRFHYRGGSLPIPPDFAVRAARIAEAAVRSVPGLAGYVGVDVVLGEEASGADDRAIEINPRLTTSYVGLRALAECNLAEAMLAAVRGDGLPPMAWRPGRVAFAPDGTVRPVL